MTQFAFGSGTVIGKRTDVANVAPAFLGVLQDIEISFDRTLKELMGQNNMPVAIAGAQLKVGGKAKFGRIQLTQSNNLFFGQTQVTGMMELAVAETGSIPTTPFAITVANAANFVEDYGVFSATTGVQYQPVPAAPTTGQYTVAAGVYTFAAADTGLPVLIYYTYNVTGTGQKVTNLSQQKMGAAPSFSLVMKQEFAQFGTNKTMILRLNACVASKLTWPFKNQDFMVQDFDFTAFADAAGNWGTISMSE